MFNRLKADLPFKMLPPIILALITVMIYLPSLHYDFQFDDISNISKHFNIRHYTFYDLFFSGSRWISYWINSVQYKIGGFDPFSYRVFNVGLHITNGLLIYGIFSWTLGQTREQFFAANARLIAFTTALLFLIHPVQTQTVSYVIQGQLEGLALFFILVMIGLFIIASTSQGWKSYGCALVLFAVAPFSCCTKEIAIISPALLLIVDWFFVAQGSWQSLKKRFWMHAIFGAIIGAVYLYLLKPGFFTQIVGLQRVAANNVGNVITQTPAQLITPGIYFISQFKVIVHYLWIFLWPKNISVEYDWVLCQNFFALDCLLPLMILAGVGYIIFKLLAKNPTHAAAFGLIWFFACIIPRSSIIPCPELLTDYKTYMASCGLLLLIAATCVKLVRLATQYVRESRRVVAQLIVIALLTFPVGTATLERNKVWHSGVEFWADIIAHAPKKARGYNNYGVELSQIQKKYAESIPYFEKAIALDSWYADPFNNLAVVYAALDEVDKGIAVLQKSLQLNPKQPESYNNLAAFMLRKKEYTEAEKMVQRALDLRAHYGKAYFNWGRIYWERGEQEKAWGYFKHACTVADLDNDFGFYNFGNASFTLRKYDDAIWAYQKVLSLNPNYPEAAFNLGNAYFYTKQFDKAITAYRQALATNPKEMRALYNLAEAYFVTDQNDNALSCYAQFIRSTQPFPQAVIRVAACYEKQKMPEQAYRVLAAFAERNSDTTNAKVIRDLMGKLKTTYAIS